MDQRAKRTKIGLPCQPGIMECLPFVITKHIAMFLFDGNADLIADHRLEVDLSYIHFFFFPSLYSPPLNFS